MSSFAGYCQDCDKPVMHKTLFGTIHLCLSPEERFLKSSRIRQFSQLEMNNYLGSIKGASSPAKLNK
jgi:hypothetical protein